MAITPGQAYLFRGASGATQFNNGASESITIEGNTGWILDQSPQHGISRTRAPAHALMGIFLSDADPRTTSTPGQQNYSTTKRRDFVTHRPRLKQVFYIGDGIRSDGSYQQFIAPVGATRLFLGVMDEFGRWSDNSGSVNIEAGYPENQVPASVQRSTTSQLVR